MKKIWTWLKIIGGVIIALGSLIIPFLIFTKKRSDRITKFNEKVKKESEEISGYNIDSYNSDGTIKKSGKRRKD